MFTPRAPEAIIPKTRPHRMLPNGPKGEILPKACTCHEPKSTRTSVIQVFVLELIPYSRIPSMTQPPSPTMTSCILDPKKCGQKNDGHRGRCG